MSDDSKSQDKDETSATFVARTVSVDKDGNLVTEPADVQCSAYCFDERKVIATSTVYELVQEKAEEHAKRTGHSVRYGCSYS